MDGQQVGGALIGREGLRLHEVEREGVFVSQSEEP